MEFSRIQMEIGIDSTGKTVGYAYEAQHLPSLKRRVSPTAAQAEQPVALREGVEAQDRARMGESAHSRHIPHRRAGAALRDTQERREDSPQRVQGHRGLRHEVRGGRYQQIAFEMRNALEGETPLRAHLFARGGRKDDCIPSRGTEWLADRSDSLPMNRGVLQAVWKKAAGKGCPPFFNLSKSWCTFAQYDWRILSETLKSSWATRYPPRQDFITCCPPWKTWRSRSSVP